jgi:cobyrinic acid a,c-diamide synthase
MSRPIVIAGTSSGVGKTTIATGIMGCLTRRGLQVAPFKVGPDYIDPGYHLMASGTASRNLDTWLTSPETVKSIYARGAGGADIAVIEGVMGMFDGRSGGGEAGSTAEIARLTGGAVVLVVDCARMSRSLAPLLYGFDRFDGGIRLEGVILNNVGSPAHARMLREAAGEAGVSVLGEIPRDARIGIGSRHLGLLPAEENGGAAAAMENLFDIVNRHVDLDGLVRIAGPADSGASGGAAAAATRIADIAVARDEAFTFYYEDGLEALEAAGARLIPFSPLRDEGLPDCDGLYLGGGFPEQFAAELENNGSMRASIAGRAAQGLPVYAECGGMVYLCRGLEAAGERHEMCGVIESEARMTGRRQALGYVEARARRSSILCESGERLRGHEFHWSAVKWREELMAYDCFSTRRPEVEPDGFCRGNILASYVHIHFAGDHGAAGRFVGVCAGTRNSGSAIA